MLAIPARCDSGAENWPEYSMNACTWPIDSEPEATCTAPATATST